MGVYERDYMRQRDLGGFLRGCGATAWLIAANVTVFVVLDFLLPGDLQEKAARLLFLWPTDVASGRAVWQVLTSLFCHAGFMHLLFNLLFLSWVGKELEALYGSRRFLLLYFLCGISGSLAYVAGSHLQHAFPPALGASGAVMGLMVVYAFHYPRQQVLFYGILPMQVRWLAVLYIVLDVSGFVHPGGGIANAAHLGGAAFGVAWALWRRR